MYLGAALITGMVEVYNRDRDLTSTRTRIGPFGKRNPMYKEGGGGVMGLIELELRTLFFWGGG